MRAAVGLTLAFIYLPLLVIGIYAFNSSNILSWPPPGFTTRWFDQAFHSSSAGSALLTSVEVGLVATAIASCSSSAVSIAWASPAGYS